MAQLTPEERAQGQREARLRWRANPENVARERANSYAARRAKRVALAAERPPDHPAVLAQQGMKRCTACGEIKPADFAHFFRSKKGRLGFSAHCRECDAVKAASYDARNPDYDRNYNLQRKYGITAAQYEDMLARQGGACAACGDADIVLCVDHDHGCCPGSHTCGRCIRGLLCRACNGVEGFIRSGRIDKVRDYLERFGSV